MNNLEYGFIETSTQLVTNNKLMSIEQKSSNIHHVHQYHYARRIAFVSVLKLTRNMWIRKYLCF